MTNDDNEDSLIVSESDLIQATEIVKNLVKERGNNKMLKISELSTKELIQKAHGGELSKAVVLTELNRRKREAAEKTQDAQDLVTAAGLAAVVKQKFMAERSEAKRQAIIKAAMDESIHRMDEIEGQLMDSNISKSRREELKFQLENEGQFQADILGGPEAVGKYWQAYIDRPKVDDLTQATTNLQKSAAGGDLIAQEWARMQADQALQKKRPDLYAIQKANERSTPEQREREREYLKRLATSS